jgi:hypothetical protein
MLSPPETPLLAEVHDKQFGRIAGVLGALLIWLISSAMVAWFEFGIFWNLPLLLFTMNLSVLDQTLIVWTLLGRTLLVTGPALAIIVASHWSGRWQNARVLAWSWHLLVLTWLIIDCGLQCVTGASLWHYVEKARMTEDLSLGGDISTLTAGLQTALAIMGVRILLLFVGIACLMRLWRTSRLRNQLSAGLKLVAGMSLVIMPGILMARQFIQNRQAMEQLHSAMALRTWLFHPDRISNYGTAAFGIPCLEEFADQAPDFRKLCRAPQFAAYRPVRVASVGSLPQTVERPNIVILLTESFRHDLLITGRLPRLRRWADRSFVGEQHFSSSNCSELGAFACLYSRVPLSYDETLDQKIPSEAMFVWKQLGYHRQLTCSCSPNFCRMNEFLGPLNFDGQTIFAQRGQPWHQNDRQTLASIAEEVRDSSVPKFVFSILMATHYSYDYPPDYDLHPPACVPSLPKNPQAADLLRDRYFKAVAFLDEQLDAFLESVSGTNTIVVITGDHGESFLDDGFLCHGTRLSDIQSRTPLMICGPGVKPGTLSVTSSHLDLMPTLLHLAGAGENALQQSHGQSLLSVTGNRSQLLTHAQTSEWNALLVHEDGRLGFTLPRNSATLQVTGFHDTKGRVDLTQTRSATEISLWKQRLEQVIEFERPDEASF